MDDLRDDELDEKEDVPLFLGEDDEEGLIDDELDEDGELDAFGMHVEDEEEPDGF